MNTIDVSFYEKMWNWSWPEIMEWFERCDDPDKLLLVLQEIRQLTRDEEANLA